MSGDWKSLLLSQVVCIPFLRRPGQSLSDPSYYGVEQAQNLKLLVTNDQFIGAWYMVPYTYDNDEVEDPGEIAYQEDFSARRLGADDKVILYLHGNAETRSQFHRKELYKVLQKSGYHILAIDYRGYGDSSQLYPNEETLSQDALVAFQWLKSRSDVGTKVIVLGHSLGTGVAIKMAQRLHDMNEERCPQGYVLCAPFNNMLEEVKTFKVSKMAAMLINIPQTLQDAKVEFESDKWIRNIRVPITILHSIDDRIVPIHLGERLFEGAKDVCDIKFVDYDPDSHQIGHDYFYRDPSLPSKLDELIARMH